MLRRSPISYVRIKKIYFIIIISLVTSASLLSILLSKCCETNKNSLDFHRASSKRRLPQAIIIGTRKSGTRALMRFLEINPAIRAARSEIHFFDRPNNYKLGLEWYREQMPESEPNQLTMEKSPAYFVTKNVAERISAMNSSIKLILVFREPVTRLISDYSQLLANKIDKIKTIERETTDEINYELNTEERDYNLMVEAKEDDEIRNLSLASRFVVSKSSMSKSTAWQLGELNFEKFILRSDGIIDDQVQAVQIGMYSNYLEKWLSLFPKEQVHFVNGEQLITDPAGELQKVESFLHLKSYIRREHFVFDTSKGFFCLNGTLLEKRNDIDTKHLCLSKSKGRRHIKATNQLTTRLRDFYKPYNEYLYTLTGIKFNDNHA